MVLHLDTVPASNGWTDGTTDIALCMLCVLTTDKNLLQSDSKAIFTSAKQGMF